MADPLITQADLEQRIGPANLAKMLDDDGDGIADPANVTWVLTTASRIAEGILRIAFKSQAQIKAIVDADDAIKNDIVEIGIGLSGGRRPGFLGADGKTPYSGWREAAEKRLKEVAEAKRRAIGEDTGGTNERLKSEVRPGTEPVYGVTSTNPKGFGGF